MLSGQPPFSGAGGVGGIGTSALSALELLIPPLGTMVPYMSDTAPAGDIWLICDGSSLDLVKYAKLIALLGMANLPDMRGRFVRGINFGGFGDDPDGERLVMLVQLEATRSHTHTIGASTGNGLGTDYNITNGFSTGSTDDGNPTRAIARATVGDETRPVNVAANFIIRAL